MSRLAIVKVRTEQDVNTYVLSDSESKEAVVVDPGAPAEKVLAQLDGLSVRWIVATHGHPGHLAGKDELKEATGATTVVTMADAKMFLRSADVYPLDGEELDFGQFKMRVIQTPGHTPGSACFLVGNHLFTGDTLLAGGIGRELPGSDLRQQMITPRCEVGRLELCRQPLPQLLVVSLHTATVSRAQTHATFTGRRV